MFYSQFILAKKGPLGTIWIAAHLERKLRKNQVADTDIGVSVDSILFPDVPIALRLSSHLLLGVVRIYSRKVNYLFDDCSETLLKIKQAFRSTAVDLPPEESTAPYNSITLPETFDLDDFELPDNDIFQGNYVDHHVSSRDQITLQDTMDGVVYSTSQFGPDERFGDGDTSGLDLDEELLLDKMAAGEADLTLGSDDELHASVQPMTPGYTNQMEGGDDDAENVEYAEGPCTPGLMQEPNLSIVQETSACDDHMETDNHQNIPVFLVKENLENAHSKSELLHQEKHNAVDWPLVNEQNSPNTVPPAAPEKKGYCSDDLESCQIKQPLVDLNPDDNMLASDNADVAYSHLKQQQQQVGKSALTMDHQNRGDILVDGSYGATVSNEHSVEGKMMFEVSLLDNNQEQSLATTQVSNFVEIDGSQKDKPSDEVNRESDDTFGNEKLGFNFCQQLKDSGTVKEYTGPHFLSPCTTNLLNQSTPLNPGDDNRHLPFEEPSGLWSSDTSTRDGTVHVSVGDVAATEIAKQSLEENQHTRPDSFQRDDFQSGNIDNSVRSDFSAPEKLVSVPEANVSYAQNDFLEATPYKEAMMSFDRSGAVSETVSGRKRSYAESSLTVQSMYSAESSGFLHTKGTVESVPEDNDLLSSILVGRKSTVLKVKPTPTETKPTKRSRSTARPSSYKRKVLMDDSMVLHGDTIREQLTNTEDIRRMRKKAPCTSTEISMIQRQFLEDEIFSKPILTGVSVELMSLHNQTYDLREIRVTQCEANNASSEVIADPKSVSLGVGVAMEELNRTDMLFQLNVTKDYGVNGNSEPMMVRDEAPQVLFADTPIIAENVQVDSTQVQANISTSDVPEAKRDSPHGNCLEESAQMENNGNCISGGTAVNPDANAVDRNDEANDASLLIEIEASKILKGTVANEAAEKTDNDADIAAAEKVLENEAACTNDEVIACHAKIVVGESGDEIAVVVETESREKDEIGGTEGGFPFASYSPEMLTTNQAILDEEIRKQNQEQTANEYTVLDEQVNDYNAKDSVFNGIWGEQDSSYPAEGGNMMDLRNAYLDYDGENCGHPSVVTEAEVSANQINDDFDYSAAGHDTGFLNFDDDDEAEVDEDDVMPSTDETRILENSGWSSRTRAVANYLQTLFEKEADRGRKVLPMDNLLSGKTRKEASRMFFEALVLKTKDYVHVEQNAPFDNINIYPRSKLLKSDF